MGALEKRVVAVVEAEELNGWHTGSLLTRLRKLWRCQENQYLSDWSDEELASVEGIVFKEDPRWSQAHRELKAILATREDRRQNEPRPKPRGRDRQRPKRRR